MGKFEPGTRVVVIGDDNEIRRGTIRNVYHTLDLAIVNMDDGNVEKLHLSDLGIEPEVKEEKPTVPVEKSEITITPKEFRDISVKVMLEESKDMSPVLSLAFMAFTVKLHKALFYDAVEND